MARKGPQSPLCCSLETTDIENVTGGPGIHRGGSEHPHFCRVENDGREGPHFEYVSLIGARSRLSPTGFSSKINFTFGYSKNVTESLINEWVL